MIGKRFLMCSKKKIPSTLLSATPGEPASHMNWPKEKEKA
jgi:hypothetical protein